MKTIWRWLKRLFILTAVALIGLLAPVGYVELACRGNAVAPPYDALLAPDHHRPETRTLMTYPEWHIVHAYDDYAQVIATGDPHDFGYVPAISGFWSSLCALTQRASAHGQVDTATKQMVYVIGVSFTAELLMKAAYEETLGRVATWLRGPDRAALDGVSARQAADYATFLQQTPWYKWDFDRDRAQLYQAQTNGLRDRERAMALGLEYSAKAGYARVIARAVASTGADQTSLQMVLRHQTEAQIAELDGVGIVERINDMLVLETPRYRALTHLLHDMARDGAEFVEIAGNDDILFTALSPNPTAPGAIHSTARQGYGDFRHLILVKVTDLAQRLRDLPDRGLTLEHIHDY